MRSLMMRNLIRQRARSVGSVRRRLTPSSPRVKSRRTIVFLAALAASGAVGIAVAAQFGGGSTRTASGGPALTGEPEGITTVSAPQTGECAVSAAQVDFVPPRPFPTEAAGAGFPGQWYGTADLWTVLPRKQVLSDKTFWWSPHFDPGSEPEPAIRITATRLDAPQHVVRTERATHGWVQADAPFMLVGLELPIAGCWFIRAEYRGYELEYVVEILP